MPTLASWLGITVLKGTLVLATALLLGTGLRRAPGQARHRLWSLAFAGLLVLPALALALPPLPLPLPAAMSSADGASWWITSVDASGPERAVRSPGTAGSLSRRPGSVAGVDTDAVAAARTPVMSALAGSGVIDDIDDATMSGPAPPGVRRVVSILGGYLPAGLLVLWLVGLLVAMTFLLAGVARGALQVRRARPLTDEGWLRDLEWHRNFFGIRRPVRLLESRQARTPMTGGLWRPVVLVPEGAVAWSPVRRRLVLLHELVHIRRYDVVRHLLARFGVALYWFHPLAWLGGRSSAIAREQACDEEVIRLGIKPSVYASHLLELAETLNPPSRAPAAALPMIQRSHLEKRLMTILDTQARPRAAWGSALAATLMVVTSVSAGIAVPMAPEPVSSTVQGPGHVVDTPAPALSYVAGETSGAAISEAASETERLVFPTGPAASAPVPAPGVPLQTSACWPEGMNRVRGSFSGTISTNDRTGNRVVNAVGMRDGDRIIQRWVDDLRLCMVVHGDVELDNDGAVIGRVGNGGSVVLEAELDGHLQTLRIANDGSGEQMTWTVDGAGRQIDAGVEPWRDQMTAVLADYARIVTLRGQRSSLRGEISSIRGQRSSLRGQISSIRGRRSSLRGEISSIRGRRSSLNGQISSARGHVSSLKGQISSARGHVSSLKGQISSHRGAISGLQSSRYGASEDEVTVIEAAIRRHEEAIRDIEQQIEGYDLEGRVAQIERQIEDYDLDGRVAEIEGRIESENVEGKVAEIERQVEALDVEGKVAEIERQIEALDVEGKVAEIERQIEALNVDERVSEIEGRLEPALRELRRTIEKIGG